MAMTLVAYDSSTGSSNAVIFRWTRDAGDAPGGFRIHDGTSASINTGVTWNVVNGATPVAGNLREYTHDPYTTATRYVVAVALDGSGNIIETSNVFGPFSGAATLTPDPGPGGEPEPSVESDMYMWNAATGQLEPVVFYSQEGGALV